jgi:hypothetical protein
MNLTTQQQEAIEDVLLDFVQEEPEVLRKAYNYGMTGGEVRKRCNRFNTIAAIINEELHGMSHVSLYSEEDIDDMAGCL